MNTVVTVFLFLMFFVLGLLTGCLIFAPKIGQLESEKACLTEWLTTARKVNDTLVKDCEELRIDIERIVNGKNLIIREDETEMD